jgi:Predicted transcription factor, homolog of eukaryotic MBF1
MDLGKNVRKLREKKGVSVSQLAALTDLDEATIYRIECHEANLSLQALESIRAALNITMADFFTEE